MWNLQVVVLCLVAVIQATPLAAATLFFVGGPGASDRNDGLSKDTPFNTIQKGIEMARDGDTVVVADGEYESEGDGNDPVVNFAGKAITVRSEKGPKNCILSGGCFVVLFESGETEASVLSGFTIRYADPCGGIGCSESSPTIRNNIITQNWSEYGYGAIWLWRSNARILGNLICENEVYGPCAGIVCDNGSSATIVNNTIAGNGRPSSVEDDNQGGIYCYEDSSATVVNCIVWGNNGHYDLHGCTATYSCIEHSVPGEGNISLDPKFASVGVGDSDYYNDYRLQLDSPAIDAGSDEENPGPDMEQHGRPCGGGIDMGAYETGGCSSSAEKFQRSDANADGTANLSDAVFVLNFLFLGGAEPDCLKSADFDDNGELDLTDSIVLLNFLFLGGTSPRPPFEECGIDPTADSLTCGSYLPCNGGRGFDL